MLKKQLGGVLLALLLPFTAKAEDVSEQLLAAARKSDVEAVKSLLAKGADVNAKSSYGVTVLSFAADRGSLEIVKTLLEHGADVNAADTFYHETPLGRAASKGYAEIVGALLEKGATGADGALEWAVYGNHIEVLKAILEKGKVKADTLSSAWAEATKKGNAQVAELLKKAGAVPPPKADFQVDPETLKTYTGTYRNQEEIEISITLKEGKLTGGFAGQDAYTLGAIDRITFRPTELAGVILIFNLESGKVNGLTLKQGDDQDTFQKVGDK
jgi:Ankyrin repeats (3 copies)/Domain of unknown function (DUF3471)